MYYIKVSYCRTGYLDWGQSEAFTVHIIAYLQTDEQQLHQSHTSYQNHSKSQEKKTPSIEKSLGRGVINCRFLRRHCLWTAPWSTRRYGGQLGKILPFSIMRQIWAQLRASFTRQQMASTISSSSHETRLITFMVMQF